MESSLQEEYDAFGRSAGCRLMLGTRTVQHSQDVYKRQFYVPGTLSGNDTSISLHSLRHLVESPVFRGCFIGVDPLDAIDALARCV